GYVGLTAATTAMTAAQGAFNVVAKANPYVLLAAGLAAVVGLTWQYVTATDAAYESTIKGLNEAGKSSAAYQAAQLNMNRYQGVFEELTRERISLEGELAELQEKGFKKYGAAATRAAEIEREINEIREKQLALQNA